MAHIQHTFKFLLLHVITSCFGEVIRLEALGRPAVLGTLYNEHTQQFQTLTVFKQKLDADKYVGKTEHHKLTSKQTKVFGFEDRQAVFDVDACMMLSVRSGIVEVKGSAEYLKKKSSSTSYCEDVTIQKYITATHELRYNYYGFASTIDRNFGQNTHFVAGVTYGANILVINRTEVHTSDDSTDIGAQAGFAFSFWGVTSSANVNIRKFDATTSYRRTITVEISADIPAPGYFESESEKDTFLKGIWEIIRNSTTNGTGSPISYVLEPVSSLQYTDKTELDPFDAQIYEPIMKILIHTFTKLDSLEAQILSSRRSFQKPCVTDEDRMLLEKCYEKFIFYSSNFTFAVKQYLRDTKAIAGNRSGNATELVISVEEKMAATKNKLKFPNTRAKIHWYNVFVRDGLPYAGRTGPHLDTLLAGKKNVSVLQIPDGYLYNSELASIYFDFNHDCGKGSAIQYYKIVADCSFPRHGCSDDKTPLIIHYMAGRPRSYAVYQDDPSRKFCFVYPIWQNLTYVFLKQISGTTLLIYVYPSEPFSR